MSFKNLQNAKIHEFIITEQNYQNVKLSIKITHIKTGSVNLSSKSYS